LKKTFLLISLFIITTTWAYSIAPVNIAFQPTNKEAFVDESVTLTATAENPVGDAQDLAFQWIKNGNNISNANTNSYSISKVALSDSGKYTVEAKNVCKLAANSIEAEIKVLENNSGPAITNNIGVLDFGDVKIGELNPETSKVSMTNSGDDNLIITAINISGAEANAFTITSPALPVVIEPESSIDIIVNFKPTKVGLNQAKMTIVSNSENNTTVELRGNGIENRTITSTVSSLSFGSVVINEEVKLKFDIENPTTKNITITEIAVSSSDFNFTVLTDPIITPNTKREIVVTFLPTEEKDYDEVLTISTDVSNSLVMPLTISTEYSNTLEIPLTAKAIQSSVWDGIPTITSTKSYPNPGENNITLEMTFDEVNNYQVSIVNLKGVEIKSFEGYSVIGSNRIIWDGRDGANTKVASGTYFAIIKVEDNIQTISIIVQ